MIAQMEDTWEATRVDWQWEGCEDGFHGRVGRFRADAASWTRNDRGERCLLGELGRGGLAAHELYAESSGLARTLGTAEVLLSEADLPATERDKQPKAAE